MISLDGIADDLDAVMPRVLRATCTVGMTVAIRHRGETWKAGYGVTDRLTEEPLPGDSTAPVGSLSKTLLALVVMRAVEAGALALDDPIDANLGFPVVNPQDGIRTTWRQAMQHVSGLAEDTVGLRWDRPPPLGECVHRRYASSWTPEYGGGRLWASNTGAYHYSNLGWATVGLAYEAVTNIPYARAAEDVLRRLGMTSSWIGPESEHPPHLVEDGLMDGHMTCGPTAILMPRVRCELWPGAGLLTNAEDYLQLLSVLTDEGARRAILGPDGVRAMRTPTVTADHGGEEAAFGVGVGVQVYPNHWGHRGSYLGIWADARAYDDGLLYVGLSSGWPVGTGDFVLPPRRSAIGIIGDRVAELVQGRARPVADVVDWDEGASRVMAAYVRDRLHLFGLGAVPDAVLEDIVRGSGPLPGATREWDADAFASAFRAMEAVGPTTAAIRAALERAEPVSRFEALMYSLAWGGRGDPKLPHTHWIRRGGN